jgi:hypothetical protein
VENSTNPTWQHLDPSKHTSDADLASSQLVVRVWGAIVESSAVSAAVPVDLTTGETFDLLVEWNVDLYGLQFLSVKMEDASVAHAKDSLVFGISGAFYWGGMQGLDSGSDAVAAVPAGNFSFLKTARNRVKRAYTRSAFQRISTLQRAIQKKQSAVAEIKAETARVLEARKQKQTVAREIEQIRTRVRLLRGEEQDQGAALKKEHAELRTLKLSTDKRAANLQSARRSSEHNIAHLVAMRTKFKESADLLLQASTMVTIRQTRIILQLHTIYPVEQLSPSQFSICSMELPSADRPATTSIDEESIATALGYVSHFVVMIAKYLNVPFRYPIRPLCSRSTIRDDIDPNLAEKDREYPLFAKGKEKVAFEQGVTLLNKNIQQLVDACVASGTTYDPNSTLPNLRLLMSHCTSSSLSSPFGSPPPALIVIC